MSARLSARKSASPVRPLLLAAVLLSSAALADRPSFKLEGSELVLPSPVVFASGTAELKSESDAALEHVQAYLTDKSYISTMRIEAHVAGSKDDQGLSEQRALSVARWLVAHGVDCKRVLPVAFGNTKPAGDASTPEGRAMNTRVVFANAALRGRPIGGMPLDGGGKVAGDACEK